MTRRQGDKFNLKVTIPANTTATVFVPAKSAVSVTESGKPIADGKGVNYLRQENDCAAFAIGSGDYVFKAKL